MMWWRDRDPSLSLAANGRQSRRLLDLGIGVYSDEPFPPLEAGRSQLQLPDFDPDAGRPPA